MAFIQATEFGDIINIDDSVGLRKANEPQDVLYVQQLLVIIYGETPFFRKRRPTKTPPLAISQLLADTPILIADFQGFVLKRARPEGFVNTARGGTKGVVASTIFNLFKVAEQSERTFNKANLIAKLQRLHPSLAGLRRVTANGFPTAPPERVPHLIDSSR